MTAPPPPSHRKKARGATFNPANRFESSRLEAFDDGWNDAHDPADTPLLKTRVIPERSRTIVSSNESPDIPFDRSINPYKGCEHGCIYCYARPTHAFLGMSPGLDFETRIVAKNNAAELLRKKFSGRNYKPQVIAIGANTDPYQPIERRLRITRSILEVMAEYRHPFAIITKSQGVLRDLDLLAPAGQAGRCRVMVSVTSLDPELCKVMEPRASPPSGRLRAIRELRQAGVPVGVMAAPMIPAINDMELESILDAAVEAGADRAGMVNVRLPLEIKELFDGWLNEHFPDRREKVLDLIRGMRGGALYQSQFGTRMRGTGPYAHVLQARFKAALRRHGLDLPLPSLDTTAFRIPPRRGDQMALL